MKHPKSRVFVLAVTGLLLIMLNGCGSSSSTLPGNTNNSGGSGNATTAYSGAASAGDMAQFTISGSTLNYTLTGAHFGAQSGSMSLSPVSGTTGFHYATVGSRTIGLMLSGNLGIAIVPNVPDVQNGSTTVNAFVTGLANASNNEADAKGKTFLYVSYQAAPMAYVLKLYTDNHFAGQKVTDYLSDLANAAGNTLNGEPGTTNRLEGCWRASTNGTYLNAVTSSDPAINTAIATGNCPAFDFVSAGYDTSPASTSSNYYRFMIKPGNSRAGLVVDMADGSGFGIGLETALESPAPVPIAPGSDLTYSAFAAPNVTSIDLASLFNTSTGASPFVQVVLHAASANTVELTDFTCNYSNSPIACNASGSTRTLNILYDTVCYQTGTGIASETLPGMNCAFNNTSPSNSTQVYNAFIDGQDGYFLAASLNAPEFVMGSSLYPP